MKLNPWRNHVASLGSRDTTCLEQLLILILLILTGENEKITREKKQIPPFVTYEGKRFLVRGRDF